MDENKNTPKVPKHIAELASDLNLKKGNARRGSPPIYAYEELSERERKHREIVRERNKAAKQMQLHGSTKEQFIECQKIESEKLNFKLSNQQTIQMLLNIYFKEEE